MNSKTADKRGFTLAELLIVVAIIAVLAAVAIPVFGAQLKKARLAADHAAIRDAYAVVQVANNLQAVNVGGVIKTFDQLDAEVSGGTIVFVLSADCSSLVATPLPLPIDRSKYYFIQETGSTEPGSGGYDFCPVCTQWDSDGATSPISHFHTQGTYIPITYVESTHRLYLGWP